MEIKGFIPDNIKYLLIVYDFTEGKNTFNMTIEEKVQHAKRKKLVGLYLI